MPDDKKKNVKKNKWQVLPCQPEQIQLQVEKEMEPKLELLLAQKIKPHEEKRKKKSRFSERRETLRRDQAIYLQKSNLKRRYPKFRENQKTMRLHFLDSQKKSLVLN